MPLDPETKARLAEHAKRKRGVLLKDLGLGDLIALTDELKERYPELVDQRHPKFETQPCSYLVYGPKGLAEGLAQWLPHCRRELLVYVRHLQQHRPYEYILFPRLAIIRLLKMAGVTHPIKYVRDRVELDWFEKETKE